MNKENLIRQYDIIPMEVLDTPITIIGCGAIGSLTAVSLAKLGMSTIEVFDHDVVSAENMSNQGFRFQDIGMLKVYALMSIVYDYASTMIGINPRKFEDKDMEGRRGIVIVAVDTMEARRMVLDSLKSFNFVKYVIDPRMSAEFYVQHCIDPQKDLDNWSKSIFSDDEAVQTPCTAKSTIYTAMLAAGMITKTVKNILLKEQHPKLVQWDIKAVTNAMDMV